MNRERFPIPAWIVVGAGTLGTRGIVGRFVRYQRHAAQVCIPDPQDSVIGDHH